MYKIKYVKYNKIYYIRIVIKVFKMYDLVTDIALLVIRFSGGSNNCVFSYKCKWYFEILATIKNII